MIPSSALPSAPLDVRGGPGIAVERVGVSTVISQNEIILDTYGLGAHYAARSAGGDLRLRNGLTLLLRIDRVSPDAPTLTLDGSPRAPVIDTTGQPLPAGAFQPNFLQRVIYDAARGVWIGERFGSITVSILDIAMRAWWLSLPEDPSGIGPHAPWRNGGTLAWTGADNSPFTLDSPEGRRQTLALIRETLPLSPEGLNPGDPWLDGDSIVFVPAPNA